MGARCRGHQCRYLCWTPFLAWLEASSVMETRDLLLLAISRNVRYLLALIGIRVRKPGRIGLNGLRSQLCRSRVLFRLPEAKRRGSGQTVRDIVRV
ncbi:hypothetical protein FKM82_025757 [Ascaphus truei]